MDDLHHLLRQMQRSRATRAASRAQLDLSKSEREAASVLSSAHRHIRFLNSQRMLQVLGRSDFRFEDLKVVTVMLFLVLPQERMVTLARCLRLLAAHAINAMARSSIRTAAPVLFLLDKVAARGRLKAVERASGLKTGYGLQLWPILQDTPQIWSVPGERSETFVSDAGHR